MEDIKDLQCCVCIQVYSDHAPPKNFKCGHSICSKCLDELGRYPECPECRARYSAKEAKEFSTNITLLRLCRLHTYSTTSENDLPPIDLNLKCPEKEPLSSEGNCSLHGHSLFFVCLTCDVPVCRGCLITEHPDQPYGKCVIVSIKEKRKKTTEVYLQTLKEYMEKSNQVKRRTEKILKGSKIALQYWEKNEKVKAEENYEENLQDIRALLEAAEKDDKVAAEFKEFFKEAVDGVDISKSMNSIDSLYENAKGKYLEFQSFQEVNRKDTLLKYLNRFWNGPALKFD